MTIKTMGGAAAVLILSFLITGSRPALAVGDIDNYWSNAGAGCVPDDTAIQGDTYATTSGGAVQEDSDNATTAVFYCDVKKNSNGNNPDWLFLTYDDFHEDVSAVNYVDATFYRMSRTTGTVTSIKSVSSDTNDSGGCHTGTCEVSGSFLHTLVFNTHTYFVRVQIVRDSTANTETFYNVALGEDIP